MWKHSKRICAFLLTMALLCTLLPTGVLSAKAEASEALTAEDYAAADQVFAMIEEMDETPTRKNATQSQLTEEAIKIVESSDSYVEGSLERSGDAFSWWTVGGIRCMYNPRLQKIQKEQTPENRIDAVVNEPVATKGGYPTGTQVYLIGPYYGSDDDFTDQYKTEATSVAAAIGDTDGYTLYSGAAATVDKVAEAVSNGAVVFFDSHGTTDYQNPNDPYDYITGATGSYLCLSTMDGITYRDYELGAGYTSDGGACVNGAVIANHMTKDSPSGIVWMAICLGMGTDTLCEPLRAKGVEVVCGYSESVTFGGEYCFSGTFWEKMKAGSTVAEAAAAMKTQWGNWDQSAQIVNYNHWGSQYIMATLEEAREYFTAFPVVVSDEDPHPGQRTAAWNETSGFYGADSLQTVKSTYTLKEGDTDIDVPLNPGTELSGEATLSFKELVNRTEFTTQRQVWKQNGVTAINDQGQSTTSIGNYYGPVRFYAFSKLTVSHPYMNKIVFRCSTATYAGNLLSSIASETGVTATKSGSEVTVTFATPRDSFVIEKLASQVRMNSLTVYWTIPEPDPITLKSMNIQLGSSMSLNLNGLASVLDQYENVYVIYEAEGRAPVKVTRYFESINQSDNTLRYNFAYEGLTILDLNLKVNYTIYGTFNGKEYHSETKSIALLTYCRSSVTSGNGAAVPCANLLKYAMAAEAYMKEKDPSLDESKFLVNVLSATELAAVETHAYADSAFNAQKTSVVHNGTRVKFKSQTLDMVSRITLLYKIQIVDSTVDTSKLTFTVEYKDTKGATQVKDYTFSDLVYEPATGYYVLKFSEFYATQMREGAKCTIYIDGVEHADYTNSIENYCYTANTSTTESEAVKYLAKRISLYGDACYATYGN